MESPEEGSSLGLKGSWVATLIFYKEAAKKGLLVVLCGFVCHMDPVC